VSIVPLRERRNLADEVSQQLIEMIVNATWAAYESIPPESELALRFEVSRTVIREAMRVLVANGMITVRHGVGAHVSPREEWRVAEPLKLLIRSDPEGLLRWLEVRLVFEAGVARLAATRARTVDLAEIEDALATMRGSLLGPTEAFIEADRRFHLAVSRATQNPAFEVLIEPLLEPLRGPIREIAKLQGNTARAVEEHEAILAALRSGNASGAESAMLAHLERVRDEIQQLRALVKAGDGTHRGS
jgi:DNA-binding FadR family transcriptional regulator